MSGEGRVGQPSFGSAGVRVRHTASVGEDVGEAQPFGQIEQGHHVLRVGAAQALLPTPYGVAVRADAPGGLRPLRAGLPPEPLQALREVVGEAIGLYVCSQFAVSAWGGPSRYMETAMGEPNAGVQQQLDARAWGQRQVWSATPPRCRSASPLRCSPRSRRQARRPP